MSGASIWSQDKIICKWYQGVTGDALGINWLPGCTEHQGSGRAHWKHVGSRVLWLGEKRKLDGPDMEPWGAGNKKCVCQRSKVRGQTSGLIATDQEQGNSGPECWEVTATQWIPPPEASLRGKQSCLGHTWLTHHPTWISGAPDNMLGCSLRRGQVCGSLPIPRSPNWPPTKNLLSFLKTR